MTIGQSGMAGYLTSEEIRQIVVSAIDSLPIEGEKGSGDHPGFHPAATADANVV